MGKSLFPINPQSESEIFEDPDERFKSLPYASEIPEVIPDAFKTPPFNLPY